MAARPTKGGLIVTTGDLKYMVLPIIVAMIRTFGRLKDQQVLDIARKAVKRRRADLSGGQVGGENDV